jgi:hypothetical protein
MARAAACARLWEQAGPDGRSRAWERRRRTFPRLLVDLDQPGAGAIGQAAYLR